MIDNAFAKPYKTCIIQNRENNCYGQTAEIPQSNVRHRA